jgi:hypothetical protein
MFRDELRSADGCLVADSGWRRNTIALSAWPVVAGLMRNTPDLRGLQFCAVGEGQSAWDASPPRADAATRTLVREVDRLALAQDRITYIDGFGHPTNNATARLEAMAVFSWPAPRTLREFGLFGGDATATANSGHLINYVVHGAFTVAPGSTLTRRVRLTFRPGATVGMPFVSRDVPEHRLGNLEVTALEGVGPQIGSALKRGRTSTIRTMAEFRTGTEIGRLSVIQIGELRAKARLALRTVTRLPTLPSLDPQRIETLLSTAPTDLAGQHNVPVESVEDLQEQLSLLQLVMHARLLRRMTLAELRTGQIPG